MKVFVGLLVLIVSSVTAEISPEFENALDASLRNLDLSHLLNVTEVKVPKSDHPHAHLNVIELGDYYDYGTETHIVYTKDGHILEMHRYTGNQKNPNPKGKQPVLLVHGTMLSSMDWAIAGPKRGLAFILADLGYDVWMGNVRGNQYSRRHVNTSITESDFWNFSFHEMGLYDLPAMIDHILKRTGYEKLIYMGHSQGTTVFFVMLSERPEYNDKIITMFSLAPVAFSSNVISPVFRAITAVNPTIEFIRRYFGVNEFKPTGEFFKMVTSIFCDKTSLTQPICSNIIFLTCGFSNELLDQELLPAILAHLPGGCSTKQIIHLSQLIRDGQFRQYDYGWWTNLDKYNRTVPPTYKFDNIKVPISLHYSSNDWLATPADVEKLHSKLPNPIGKFRVPHETFNHLDFVWGLKVKSLLYDKIISIMKRQEKLNGKKKP